MNWKCPNCDWWNAADEKTCVNCGADNPANPPEFPLWILGAAILLFVLGLVGIVTAEELDLVP